MVYAGARRGFWRGWKRLDACNGSVDRIGLRFGGINYTGDVNGTQTETIHGASVRGRYKVTEFFEKPFERCISRDANRHAYQVSPDVSLAGSTRATQGWNEVPTAAALR